MLLKASPPLGTQPAKVAGLTYGSVAVPAFTCACVAAGGGLGCAINAVGTKNNNNNFFMAVLLS